MSSNSNSSSSSSSHSHSSSPPSSSSAAAAVAAVKALEAERMMRQAEGHDHYEEAAISEAEDTADESDDANSNSRETGHSLVK